MTEVHYYVAEDGTQFRDSWECQRYEQLKLLESCKDEFQFFYHDREPITDLKNATSENVDFIVIKTERAAESVDRWFEIECASSPFGSRRGEEKIGTFQWECVPGEWRKIEEELAELDKTLNELNSMMIEMWA